MIPPKVHAPKYVPENNSILRCGFMASNFPDMFSALCPVPPLKGHRYGTMARAQPRTWEQRGEIRGGYAGGWVEEMN